MASLYAAAAQSAHVLYFDDKAVLSCLAQLMACHAFVLLPRRAVLSARDFHPADTPLHLMLSFAMPLYWMLASFCLATARSGGQCLLTAFWPSGTSGSDPGSRHGVRTRAPDEGSGDGVPTCGRTRGPVKGSGRGVGPMVPIRGPDAGSGHEVGPRVTIRGPDAGSGPGFLGSGGRAPCAAPVFRPS